ERAGPPANTEQCFGRRVGEAVRHYVEHRPGATPLGLGSTWRPGPETDRLAQPVPCPTRVVAYRNPRPENPHRQPGGESPGTRVREGNPESPAAPDGNGRAGGTRRSASGKSGVALA